MARRVEELTNETDLGVLVITHYSRLLSELHPDRVHVLAQGRIVASGGPELAEELEETGYADFAEQAPVDSTKEFDPFGDPFAEPLRDV